MNRSAPTFLRTGAPPTSLIRRMRRLIAASPQGVGLGIGVALVGPLLAALALVVGRNWNPVLDLAMTELRVRDVGSAHTPLVGLPGRIGVFPDQGSHPGPLSFYALAPIYRALGSSAWALLAAMMVLAIVAIGLVLWLAYRRGGTTLMFVFAGVLVIVLRGYGLDVIIQPWNPYLPLLFWLVVLMATWSVLAGDRAMVVVVVAAGSLCAQTHLPYLGLSLGMGALCVLSMANDWRRHPTTANNVQRCAMAAVLVGIVLWLPVLIDQLANTPGNVSMLRDYFGSPPEQPVGLGEGVRLVLRHLDVFRLVPGLFGGDGFITRAAFRLDGSPLPGLILLLVWSAAAYVAWSHRHSLLSRLNVVIAWSLILSVVSMSRIFGKVWFYLTLWAWTTTLLMVVSVLWTIVAVGRTGVAAPDDPDDVIAGGGVVVAAGADDEPVGQAARSARAIGVWMAMELGVIVAVGSYAALWFDSAQARVPEQHLSEVLDELVEPTAEALRDGLGASDGADGRFLVTWNDARYFGSQGYGLVNELERRGFDVGVPDTWRVPVTKHRVIPTVLATAEVRLATGFYIEVVRALPDAALVIELDPRDAVELAEYRRLETNVASALTALGAGDLVPLLNSNLFGVQLDPRVPAGVQEDVDRMLELGTPTAVFIVPAGSPL